MPETTTPDNSLKDPTGMETPENFSITYFGHLVGNIVGAIRTNLDFIDTDAEAFKEVQAGGAEILKRLQFCAEQFGTDPKYAGISGDIRTLQRFVSAQQWEAVCALWEEKFAPLARAERAEIKKPPASN